MSIKKLVSTLLFVVIIGLAVSYYIRHAEEFHFITTVSAGAVIVLVILELALIVSYGFQLKIVTDHYDLNLNFFQWLGLARMTSFTNLVFGFAGGTTLKAVYLRRFHNFKYSYFIAATLTTMIIKGLLVGSFAVALLFLSGKPSMFLISVAGLFFLGALSFLVLGHKLSQNYLPPWSKLRNLLKEWQQIRKDHEMIQKLIPLSCIIFSIYTLEIYVSFRAFSVDASIVLSGIISAFEDLSGTLKLIPANFGIKEALFIFISNSYGIGINEAIHAAALHRIIRMGCTLLIAPGFVYPLAKKATANDCNSEAK